MKKPNWFRSVLKLISLLRIPLFIVLVILVVNSTVFFMDISDKIRYILYLAQDFSIIFFVVMIYVYRHEIYPISRHFKSKKDYITVSKIMTVILLSMISLNIFFHVIQMLSLQWTNDRDQPKEAKRIWMLVDFRVSPKTAIMTWQIIPIKKKWEEKNLRNQVIIG